MFVSAFWQVGGFPRVLLFPPPINLPPRYIWNIVESGIKHHKPTYLPGVHFMFLDLIMLQCKILSLRLINLSIAKVQKIQVLFKRKNSNIRPNKKICVFTVTCQQNLGSVGRHYYYFFFFIIGKTRNIRSGIRYFIFEISGKSLFVLKLYNDELRSFSTFFALNFNKKLAVE